MNPVATHLDPLPGHRITVTVGDLGSTVGRAWMDCQCGITATRATRWAAEQAGLIHHAGDLCEPCAQEVYDVRMEQLRDRQQEWIR